MKTIRTTLYTLVAASAIVAVGAGLLALTSEVDAAPGPPEPCRCIPFFDPVVCKGGRQFPNQCEADCARAKDCEPLPGTVIGPNGV